MDGIEYKATKNNTEFKPRTALDLSIGYTPTTTIQGVRQLYRPQVQIKQETPKQESPAEPVSIPEEQSEPAMIVATPERRAELSKPIVEPVAKKGKRYSDKNEFIKDMTAAYTKVLTDRGISTEYAKMLVAQDALESN